jgi:mRNA guanylyltransferase
MRNGVEKKDSQKGIFLVNQRYPFKMSLKELQFSYKLPHIFKQMENLNHKSDGVIFTKDNAPYVLNTNTNM